MAFEEKSVLFYCCSVSNEKKLQFQCEPEGKGILGVNWDLTIEILALGELSGWEDVYCLQMAIESWVCRQMQGTVVYEKRD